MFPIMDEPCGNVDYMLSPLLGGIGYALPLPVGRWAPRMDESIVQGVPGAENAMYQSYETFPFWSCIAMAHIETDCRSSVLYK